MTYEDKTDYEALLAGLDTWQAERALLIERGKALSADILALGTPEGALGARSINRAAEEVNAALNALGDAGRDADTLRPNWEAGVAARLSDGS